MTRGSRLVSLAILPIILFVMACGGNNEPGASAENAGPDSSTAISKSSPPLTIWKQVSVGETHACAISTKGKLYCWGWNHEGQLGFNNAGENASIPTQVDKASNWKAVAVGDYHTCALQGTGAVYCWGHNNAGQLGVKTPGDTPKHFRVGGTALFTSLATAKSHTCARKKDGSLWCWGSNNDGQLGNGSTKDAKTPVRVGTATNWKNFATGFFHTCATRTDGTLWCWGHNSSGQLGLGNTADQTRPKKVGSGKTWVSVATSDNSSFGLKKDHTLWCWGSQASGVLGLGGGPSQKSPVQVTSATDNDWAKLDMGGSNACATKTSGALWCWGSNSYGQLGQGNLAMKGIPTLVAGATCNSVSVGNDLICAVRSDKSIICAGGNNFGQIGNGTPGLKRTPSLAYSTTFSNIHAGYNSTCAVLSGGGGYVYCTGQNEGALGNADSYNQKHFILSSESQSWSQVASGYRFSCFANTGSKLYCTGDNDYGQLGINSTVPQDTPILVNGDTSYAQFDLGSHHACGIRNNLDTLWCWGYNYYGQLGDGTTVNRNVPTRVGSGTLYSEVATGAFHTCALNFGSVYCWGQNYYGQLGDGSTANQKSTPVRAGPAGNWSEVSAGYSHTCARKYDNTIWCWGSNYSGELGNGTTANSKLPVQAGTDNDWSALALGNYVTCAQKSSGALYCWGNNTFGQLAQPAIVKEAHSPQQVGTDTDWLLLTVGQYHVCATKLSALYCWGDNSYGQIPDSSAWYEWFQTIVSKSP